MADHPARIPVWLLFWRATRFMYLLWGGMLLIRLAYIGQMRLPTWAWSWPKITSKLASPAGRGLLLGLGLVLALAALREMWELVDAVLQRIMNDRERQR
jgi:hypothetical protein